MAKTQDKPTPQRKKSEKGAKPRAAPKTVASKASNLSQEYVVDSEDEDAAPQDRGVKKVANPIRAGGQAVGTSAGEVIAASTSEESEEETDDESGDENDVLPPRPPHKAPVKVNGVKRTSSQSEEESDESEEEEESTEPAAKRQKADSDATTESSDEDEDEDDGDGGKEEVPAATEVVKPSKRAASADGESQTVSEPIAAEAFRPPAGYNLLDAANADITPGFTASSLARKQIWHITAPSDVPLSSINEVALDAIQSGRPLLSHKGADYVLNEGTTENDSTTVFVFGKDGVRPAESRVEKTLHLQQKITLPNLSVRQASQTTGSTAAGDIAQASVSNVRPQPKGLRMRFRPPGYGTGKLGKVGSGSDSAEEDEAQDGSAALQFPRTLGAHGTSEPQADAGAVAQEPNGPSKKPKKKRKEKQKDLVADNPMVNGLPNQLGLPNAAAEVSHLEGTTASAAATPAKFIVAPEAKGNGDVTMKDAATPVKISKEEKARRKEERRLRKETKLKAKMA